MAIQRITFSTLLENHGAQGLPAYPSGIFLSLPEWEVALWQNIKQHLEGDQGIGNIMAEIEKKHEFSQSNPEGFASEKAQECFVALKEILARELKKNNIAVDGRKSFDEVCLSLQALRNKAMHEHFEALWNKEMFVKFRDMGGFSGGRVPLSLPEIRSWISSHRGSECLSRITSLDLSRCGFQVLPVEISYCKRLKNLQLGHNCFLTFPYDLNTWPELERCNLSSNRLEYFLHNTQPHHCLIELDLSSNDLKTFHYNFNNYPCLEFLRLHDNFFDDLSCILTQCGHLKELTLTTDDCKDFDFALPPAVKLSQGLITSMYIPGFDFSFPGLPAVAHVFVPMGWRLSVFVYPFSIAVCSFSLVKDTWRGTIPLGKLFKFAVVTPHGRCFSETGPKWRQIDISCQSNASALIFDDIRFSLDALNTNNSTCTYLV